MKLDGEPFIGTRQDDCLSLKEGSQRWLKEFASKGAEPRLTKQPPRSSTTIRLRWNNSVGRSRVGVCAGQRLVSYTTGIDTKITRRNLLATTILADMSFPRTILLNSVSRYCPNRLFAILINGSKVVVIGTPSQVLNSPFTCRNDPDSAF